MEVSVGLTVAWLILLGLAIFIYAVLDGFDLGIGTLFALYPDTPSRDVLMNSVAPVWDGNETWLVLGGGGLFAAFPMAYAILMPALYAPVIAMLLALILRGVAFEFRWRTQRWKRYWDLAFISGSTMAGFSQGVILGAILQGVEVDGRAYGGGWWDWLSPFSVLCGLALVTGYGLLGATYLIMKTEGEIQAKARKLGWGFGLATLVFIAVVSLFTPYLEPAYYQRWFTFPAFLFTAPVPVAVATIGVMMFKSLNVHHHEYRPFALAIILFALCFLGLGISTFPYVVPPTITIFEAATPFKSQLFMFVGAVVLIPIILTYTAYSYWVFRGKVNTEQGYH